jgi:sulfonate transport system substrate-binding protein
VHSNPRQAAEILSKETGIEIPALETAISRMAFGVKPLDDRVVAEQQKIADTFFELGLIPRKVPVADVNWTAGF